VLGELVEKARLDESVEPTRVVVSVPEGARAALSSEANALFSRWFEGCITGLQARVTNQREPVLAQMRGALTLLGLDAPPLPETGKTSRPRQIDARWSREAPRSSFTQTLFRTFRASMSMLFVVSLLTGVLLSLVSQADDGATRQQVLAATVGVFLATSALLTWFNRQAEPQTLLARLRDDLRSELRHALDRAANEARDELLSAVDTYASDLDLATALWEIEAKSTTARQGGALALLSDLRARRTMADLATRCIAALEARVVQLKEPGQGRA